MSVVSDFLAKQKAFNDRDDAATSAIVTSVDGLTGDIKTLNDTILALRDAADGSPEERQLMTQLESQGEAAATKLEGISTALKTLDDSTPPSVPATS